MLAGRGTESGVGTQEEGSAELKEEQALLPGWEEMAACHGPALQASGAWGQEAHRGKWVLLGHSPGNFLNLMQPEYQARDYNLALH